MVGGAAGSQACARAVKRGTGRGGPHRGVCETASSVEPRCGPARAREFRTEHPWTPRRPCVLGGRALDWSSVVDVVRVTPKAAVAIGTRSGAFDTQLTAGLRSSWRGRVYFEFQRRYRGRARERRSRGDCGGGRVDTVSRRGLAARMLMSAAV